MQAVQALMPAQFAEHSIRVAREWTPIKRCKMWMDSRAHVATLAVAMLLGCNKEKPDVTPSGAINLAGCPVPAGIEWAEAESIGCGQSAVSSPQLEPAGAGSKSLSADGDVVDMAVAKEAERSEGAAEYREARRSSEGDLTGDGRPELVVLFTLEGTGGGNVVGGYLAAFQRQANGQLGVVDTIQVTGYGGSAQDVRIERDAALVKFLVQGPDDPVCCPSQEMEVRYVLHHGRLLQVHP